MRLGLGGFVGNDSGGVFIEVEGPAQTLDRFQVDLQAQPPPLAVIESISAQAVPVRSERHFTIVASVERMAEQTWVAPDHALCDDCRRELFDQHDRRYLYPFINCTNCGPRFTIIRSTPYDRPLTSMSGFAMCPACRSEYENPADRRFHAQPIACPLCGPQLTLRWSSVNQCSAEEQGVGWLPSPVAMPAEASQQRTLAAIRQAQAVLMSGGVLAVKGLGGYHLACAATSEQAVALLRQRKRRADKPFAIMAASLAEAERIVYIDAEEAALIASRARPIVLLRKREGGNVVASVAPGNSCLGVMLPYTPLHELLLHDLGDGATPRLLVMTSGNLSEEPIIWHDEEALAKLETLVDAFLLHDRPIHVPCDDSVVQVVAGCELPVRRARGYAPLPIKLPMSSPPLLAAGADLKSALCLAEGRYAILSQHIGNRGSVETEDAFTQAAEHLQSLFHIRPQLFVCDAHPGYLSTRWIEQYAAGRPILAVQHHHAHVAALMAEHGVGSDGSVESVIGFSFDGTGYGTDGAIWGGEVLIAGYRSFERRAHLRYTPMLGGDTAVRRPYRMALAQLWAAGVEWDDQLPAVAACPAAERKVLLRQLATGFNSVPTSSIGRLCDAVAALVGVRQVVTYEAQAAIELEALAQHFLGSSWDRLDWYKTAGYHFDLVRHDGCIEFDAASLIQKVVADVQAGQVAGQIAVRFHAALVHLIVDLSVEIRAATGIGRVALSGGVFQNRILLGGALQALRRIGFVVLVHRCAPPNDGGLALGQAAVAAASERNDNIIYWSNVRCV